jgi:hypothetical protein
MIFAANEIIFQSLGGSRNEFILFFVVLYLN